MHNLLTTGSALWLTLMVCTAQLTLACGGAEPSQTTDSGVREAVAPDAEAQSQASAPQEPGQPPSDAEVQPEASAPQAPGQPPAGAYQACSEEPLPELTLTTVLMDLAYPIRAITPRNDAQTMFVVERGQGDGSGTGALKRFNLNEDNPAPTVLLSLNVSTGGEMGFLDAALHPNFDGLSETRIYLSFGCRSETDDKSRGNAACWKGNDIVDEGDLKLIRRC